MFSFSPPQFLFWVAYGAVRAGPDNIGDPLPEKMADRIQSRQAALILDCIVQQRGNRLILVPTSLKNQSAYAHEVGNVGDRDAFPGLLVMQPGGELQGGIKSPS